MSAAARAKSARPNQSTFSITLGLSAALLFFVAAGYIAYNNVQVLKFNSVQVSKTHDTILTLSELASLLKDAETGQRGYLLTGENPYLQPYEEALENIENKLKDIEGYTADNTTQQASIVLLQQDIQKKLSELDNVINIRRSQGFEQALRIVKSGSGKQLMDSIRTRIEAMQAIERTVRLERIQKMNDVYVSAIISSILTSLIGMLLGVSVAYLLQRSAKLRERQDWLQVGENGISAAVIGDKNAKQLGENILTFFADYFGAQAGAFFIKDGKDYRRVATYGIPQSSSVPERFIFGDGLLGQVAKDKKFSLLSGIPEGYLTIGSALGQGNPRHLLIAPALHENNATAVYELGFLEKPNDLALELIEKVSDAIGIAVKAADYRAHLQNLLEQTQLQSEELQTQSEELRVSNEELEEQGRALKESQARLEQQQAELEQTNSQLEEQAQQLELQKQDLERSNLSVTNKAKELEQASQYKSDFLANMSHELRTPLNSSLILAKLLADNKDGNLTDEQVKFAKTIQSAGNDLLALINDILDLSKIEAGHMEISAQPVYIASLTEGMANIFHPMAREKGLEFSIDVSGVTSEVIETDRMRLEQVLKNLLSNALKFTEKGKICLEVKNAGDAISFAVKDTGMGIAPEQHRAIFDAFRQADGSISRKYGGTGLGLSISQEISRLLGGRIDLQSEVGSGSVFTLVLPLNYDPSMVLPARHTQVTPVQTPAEQPSAPVRKKEVRIIDDREKITRQDRRILVVEDDAPFAKIVYDLIHDLGFKCLVCSTAEDALLMAKQYLPNAIVLDVGLPDNSGLTVLDRLKNNEQTRHIPVHVVSANDYMQTALQIGAVGYMLKPIKYEELTEALKKIEERLSQNMRRILLVEDDKVQRESIKQLIQHKDVETIAVGTAAECLEKLKNTTFDCMIMDLSLPDQSGFEILEKLSQEDAYSFPPVIIYTGRDLKADEEQKLRRYSKSIIIKGAKSPERLLDEVSLFLHHVVSDLPIEQQRMLRKARSRDAALENRRILIVEDDMRNIYSLTNVLEPHGVKIEVARNGKEALDLLDQSGADKSKTIDLVLMDVMMPEMDGLTATREIRKRKEWKKLPVIMLTAKAMRDDQERCLQAGANDYMAKPLDVEKLLSLVRVWMPR
jgi:CheY-like chemotaxis protein/CHASE3 domain sensor protein